MYYINYEDLHISVSVLIISVYAKCWNVMVYARLGGTLSEGQWKV
jgi:hypothetical protein